MNLNGSQSLAAYALVPSRFSAAQDATETEDNEARWIDAEIEAIENSLTGEVDVNVLADAEARLNRLLEERDMLQDQREELVEGYDDASEEEWSVGVRENDEEEEDNTPDKSGGFSRTWTPAERKANFDARSLKNSRVDHTPPFAGNRTFPLRRDVAEMLNGLPTNHTLESRIAYYRQVISHEYKYRVATKTVHELSLPSENVMRMAFTIGKGKPFSMLSREVKSEISHIRDNYVKNLKGITRKVAAVRANMPIRVPGNKAYEPGIKAPAKPGRSKTTRDAQRDTQDGSTGGSPDAATGEDPFFGWFPELSATLGQGLRCLGIDNKS